MRRRNWWQRFKNGLTQNKFKRLGRRSLDQSSRCVRTLGRVSRSQLSGLKHWLKGTRNAQEWRSPNINAPEPNGGAPTPERVERFNCPSEVDAVPQILAWLESLNLDLTAAMMWECRIILVEAFTNAVRHAHKDLDHKFQKGRAGQVGLANQTNQEKQLFVGLIIEVWEDWLEIQVWDWGDPFDLPGVLEVMRRQNEAEPLRYGSGRGLLLMEQVSDRLVYERRGDRNCLAARKKLNRNPR
ncbi:MAG: ATP-binding protein [Cyanobacteria bacterium P01_D01_bin.73]